MDPIIYTIIIREDKFTSPVKRTISNVLLKSQYFLLSTVFKGDVYIRHIQCLETKVKAYPTTTIFPRYVRENTKNDSTLSMW